MESMTNPPTGSAREHVWYYPEAGCYITVPFCQVCGVVKRKDGKNGPCKGETRLRPMEQFND